VSVEIRREILAELGRGDEIAVAERLKAEAVTLTTLLDDLPGDDRQLTAERVQEVLAATSPACESFLEVALPIVEYGKGVALEALPPALRRATLRTRAGSTDQTARRVASVPAIGRLIWALAAFALHCDRPAVLVALGRERIQVPFYDDVEPVLSLTALRHPDALERNAGLAFRDYSEWLSHLDLLDEYPVFREELEMALLEADLVLALYASRSRDRVYSSGRTTDVARRFAARANDTRQRKALEQLFPGDGTLEERLERAYAATEGDRSRFDRGPVQLFGGG
jgi:hypothetical protein